ncbi:proline/betaine transporter [Rickettsia felis]|nr:proline/betaine transporter [Rickettsia felis]
MSFLAKSRNPVLFTVTPWLGSTKTIKNTNNISIFNWIPWSSL